MTTGRGSGTRWRTAPAPVTVSDAAFDPMHHGSAGRGGDVGRADVHPGAGRGHG